MDLISVGAVGAAAPSDFHEDLFCILNKDTRPRIPHFVVALKLWIAIASSVNLNIK